METLVFRVVYLVFLPDCFYTSLFSMACLIFWIFIVYSFFLAVYLVFVMAKLVFRVFCVFGIFTLSRDLQLPSLVVGLASKVLLRVLLQVLRHKLLPQNVQTVTSRNENDQFILTKHGHMDSVLKNAFEMHLEDGFSQRWMGDELLTQEYTFSNLWFENQRSQPIDACFFEPNKSKGCFDACFHRKFANVFRKKSFPDFSFHLCLFLLLRMSRITMLLTRPQRRRITPTAIRKTWLRKTMWTLLLLKMQEIRKENVKPAQPSEKGNTGDWWDWAQSYEKYLHLTLHLSFLPPLTNHFVWN